MDITPKERMLRAYTGRGQDRAPVAPEFWNYIGAKTLGVSMETFEREGLLAEGLCAAFRVYNTEGWCIAIPTYTGEDRQITERTQRLPDGRLRAETVTLWRGKRYSQISVYDSKEPSWVVKRLAETEEELPIAAEMALAEDLRPDTAAMTRVWRQVGDDCLCEAWTGCPFFDFLEELAGFETAVAYLADEEKSAVEALRDRYIRRQLHLVDQLMDETPFEAFTIGCSSSCNSLLGPKLWRQWDKPYIRAMAERLHSRGKLLHIHFHGRSMETVQDFAELGIDCVCPFERGPGGDVNTGEDLLRIRRMLENTTTFNGNVHTVDTLLRGKPEDVRREVRQLKEVFAGSSRLIIGTGDQVAGDTPQENLFAMVEEAKRIP